jgi:formylglycine-generating enzyme required for sulfatase activity
MTPEGLHDMAGNAAEWTREGKSFVARGGSFKSEQAADLKAWASEKTSTPSAHVGLRCAYDMPKG